MWFIYSIKYYSAIKNKDIFNFVGKRTEIEMVITTEVTQTQKDTHDI